jgi:hypothetical protein
MTQSPSANGVGLEQPIRRWSLDLGIWTLIGIWGLVIGILTSDVLTYEQHAKDPARNRRREAACCASVD